LYVLLKILRLIGRYLRLRIVIQKNFYGDRTLKHIKSLENICCWIEQRSHNHKLEKMIIEAIALLPIYELKYNYKNKRKKGNESFCYADTV